MTGEGGPPWLIDPAAYGGHREIDLAMLRAVRRPVAAVPRGLRGGPAARRRATRSASLWQLLPLLVHAALFGGGWGASAVRAARRAAQ